MEGIKDRVAVIGVGCTKFGERWDVSGEDMMVEAAYEAYEDAGIEPKDIQAAWLGSQWCTTGQPLTHALKLEYIPVTRVENGCGTGTDAFRNACYAVAAGIYDMVLALGFDKNKDTGTAGFTLPVGLPGVTAALVAAPTPMPVQFALLATRYFHQYGLSFEEGKETLAKISVKNHHNGTLNPRAHFQKEVTVEQVINAPVVAWPLGLYDCCGVSDGASAAIITRPDIARSLKKDYVLVKALSISCGALQGVLQDSYDFVHFEENVTAAARAYKEAEIKNPREEIDVAIVHDCFSISELVIYEDLGFSPRGKAKEDVDSGFFALEGGLPVNTDGGLKSLGHPVGATGLRMIYEVCKQVQGKAGARQIKKADIGLTHNLGGRPGTFTCAIAILGREGV